MKKVYRDGVTMEINDKELSNYLRYGFKEIEDKKIVIPKRKKARGDKVETNNN